MNQIIRYLENVLCVVYNITITYDHLKQLKLKTERFIRL